MGGARRRNSGASSSSSGEEDGDAEWRAAIDSVAVASSTGRDRAASTSNGSTTESLGRRETKHDEVGNRKPQNIKHYQIKVIPRSCSRGALFVLIGYTVLFPCLLDNHMNRAASGFDFWGQAAIRYFLWVPDPGVERGWLAFDWTGKGLVEVHERWRTPDC